MMMLQVRRGARASMTLLVASIISLGVAHPASQADQITFDPDGAGSGSGPITIAGLDWAVGNAVAINGNQAVANFLAGSGSTGFEVRYQAKLAGYINLGGTTIQPPGITNGDFEITVVARIFENVINATPSGQATFARAAVQAGGF